MRTYRAIARAWNAGVRSQWATLGFPATNSCAYSSRSTAKSLPQVLPQFTMHGKVAAVTGGARGLGFAVAQGLAQSGASVAIIDLDVMAAREAAERLTKSLPEGSTQNFYGWSCDVASSNAVNATFTDVIDHFGGRVDTIVTAAGFCENIPAEHYPEDRMKRMFDVNVFGTMYCAQAFARHCIENGHGGSAILIASMSGSIVNINQPQAPYNMSKAAVKHMAACLGVEWAPYGIRVNSVSPGYMMTDLARDILETKPERKQLLFGNPMKRMGEPTELQGIACFLASDASSFATASDYRVDGGYCAA